jgi:hypothetical protein
VNTAHESTRFAFAVYRLEVEGNPDPLRKELGRLEKTTIGKQIVKANEILAEHATAETVAPYNEKCPPEYSRGALTRYWALSSYLTADQHTTRDG